MPAPPRTGTVSVLIPTRGDRALLLTKLVGDLHVLQRNQPWIVEVVVGFDPGDGSTKVAAWKFEGASSFVAHQRGASHVRNELAARSRGEFLAFLDDDVALADTWVLGLAHAAQGFARLWVGAIDDTTPSQSSDRIREQIGYRDFGPAIRSLSLYEHAAGANMVVRRDLFDELDGFRPIFGGRNEDVDFHRRAITRTNVMWHPALRVTHLLPQSQSAFNWHAQGQSDGFVDGDLRGLTRLHRTLVGLLRWTVSATPVTYSAGYFEGIVTRRRSRRGQ